MAKYLKHKEFVPFAPQNAGVTRINHSAIDCDGSSNSMRIENDGHDNIWAYCHRCGKSGSYRSPYSQAKGTRGVDSETDSKQNGGGHKLRNAAHYIERFEQLSQSKDCSILSRWSELQRNWIRRAGLGQAEVEYNGLAFDSTTHDIYLPVRHDRSVVGFQVRRNSGRPKYITHLDSGACSYHCDIIYPDRRVVIVEDILSAIKVGRYHNALALLGSGAQACTIAHLVRNFNKFLIFLDDDNPTVKKQQRVLRNTLRQVGEAEIVTGMGMDPKECPNHILEALW